MLVLLLRKVILMHVSPLATSYSSFLHLFVSKSFFMRFAKKFRKGKWIITLMEKYLREKHQGHQGLQDQLLDLGHPKMKILCH
jgi:hypothetical protein